MTASSGPRATVPTGKLCVSPTGRATYRELNDRVDHLARSLLALGTTHGDKVAILMPQSLDNLALFLAATRIGAVAVPINTRFKAHELRHIVVDSDTAVLFTSSDIDAAAALTEAFPQLRAGSAVGPVIDTAPALRRIVDYGATSTIPRAVPGTDFEAGAVAVDDDELFAARYGVKVRDIATIMYTSGTTDAPKGAMITHETLVREGMMVSRTRLRLTAQDRVWSVLPFFHIGGISFATACFAATATYVHAGEFRPHAALRQLDDERCTVALAGFETIWLPVLTHADFAGTDLTTLRLVFCLGIPERMREMQTYLPNAALVSGYGSTETCSFIVLCEPTDPVEARMTTAGRVLPGLEVKVVDAENGLDLPAGTVGEILCRGWSRFEGYYKDAVRTAAAIDGDGWFHSGDLGTLDDHGRVAWTSRLKDMMKVGGENVAALEIEGFLLEHPAVLMAQVVAAPDAHYTEVPAAFILLRPGRSATEEAIIQHCLGRIATFKVPRYVRFVAEWPMSGTKIQKFVLREQIALEIAASGVAEAPRLSSGARPR